MGTIQGLIKGRCLHSSQLDLIYSYAKVENQTIVKNIIERTLEEITEETIGKNNEEHGK